MTFTGRKGTALLAALIVSLCVNLLLAGVMIGGRWHRRAAAAVVASAASRKKRSRS